MRLKTLLVTGLLIIGASALFGISEVSAVGIGEDCTNSSMCDSLHCDSSTGKCACISDSGYCNYNAQCCGGSCSPNPDPTISLGLCGVGGGEDPVPDTSPCPISPGTNPDCETRTRNPITSLCDNVQLHVNASCTTSNNQSGSCKLSGGSISCVATQTSCSLSACAAQGLTSPTLTSKATCGTSCDPGWNLIGTLPGYCGGNVDNTCHCCKIGPYCGDGTVNQSHEECDDGNTANGDGCASDCQIQASPECGNGILETYVDEECDDGNTANGDNCSSTCKIEEILPPSSCSSSCQEDWWFGDDFYDGDGIVPYYGSKTQMLYISEPDSEREVISYGGPNATIPDDLDTVFGSCADQIKAIWHYEGNGSWIKWQNNPDLTYLNDLTVMDSGKIYQILLSSGTCLWETPYCNYAIDCNTAGNCNNHINCQDEPVCGNGNKEEGEECDDGNLTDGDDCSSSCLREAIGQCSDCGVGALNLCDLAECKALGDCVFIKGRLLNSCRPGTKVTLTVKDRLFDQPQNNVAISITPGSGTNGGAGCTTNNEGACSVILLESSWPYTIFIYDLRYVLDSKVASPFRSGVKVSSSEPIDVALNPYLINCTDSDPENDYYIKGESSQKDKMSQDYCQGNQLYQYQCVNNTITRGDPYECSNSCADGVCVRPTGEEARAKINLSLKNENNQAITGVRAVVSSAGNCITEHDGSCSIEGIYPDDYTFLVNDTFYSCLSELGCPKSFTALPGDNKISLTLRKIPLQMEICSDTDHGLDYYKKGAAKDNKSGGGAGRTVIDKCHADGAVRGGGKLEEAFCMANGFAWTETYTCPNGCKDDACIGDEPTPIPCTDTDGGINFSRAGTAVDATGDYTDYCQGDYIEEYYCEDDDQVGRTTKRCADDSCVNGVCTKEQPVLCLDTDTSDEFPDGQNFFRTGTASDVSGSHKDTCDWNTGELLEYYCSGDYQVSVATKECINNSCSSGICLDGLVDDSPVDGVIVAPIGDEPYDPDEPPFDEEDPSDPGTPSDPSDPDVPGLPTLTCEDCGGSLIDSNLCDRDECMGLGDCAYDGGRAFNKCIQRHADQVTPEDGGEYKTTPSGTPHPVTVSVPARAIPSEYSFGEISVRGYNVTDDNAPRWARNLPSGINQSDIIGGYVYNLEILSDNDQEIRNFNQPVTVSVQYKASDLEGLEENDILFHLYSSSANKWDTFHVKLDKSTNTIRFETTHFSLGFATEASISSIVVSPPTGSLISGDLSDVVSRILGWIFFVVVILAPLMIIIGSYMYMTSRGEAEKTQKAKRLILWAILGLVVAASGKIIISVINDILGI